MGTQEWLSFYRGDRLNQKIRFAVYEHKLVVRSIYSDDEKRLRSVVKLLNYVFFDRYHISRLTEIRPEMVKDFLNDYGLCRLLDYVRRKPAMYEDRILSLALECDSKCAMDRSSMSLLIFARRKSPIRSCQCRRNQENERAKGVSGLLLQEHAVSPHILYIFPFKPQKSKLSFSSMAI